MKEILAAVDGSQTSWKALELAAQLARNTGARLIITTVVSGGPLTLAELEPSEGEQGLHPEVVEPAFATVQGENYSPALEQPKATPASDSVRLAAARRLMTVAVFEARRAGSAIVETLVESGDPANRILAIVKSRAPDLVVVGSRGLGARAEDLLGGVSGAVVNRAPCPVLVVKPSDGEE
jgi:nucleotide-binding universal stress UspA family protein